MERLTIHDGMYKRLDPDQVEAIYKKLRAYEDTGLEPADIEELLAERDRYKSFFDRITDLPDCNICLKKNRCEFEPRPGEYTRINCAFCLTAPPKEVE